VLGNEVGLGLVGLAPFKHVRAEVLHVVRHLAELVPPRLLLDQQLLHTTLQNVTCSSRCCQNCRLFSHLIPLR
jgi:hypothetical protein